MTSTGSMHDFGTAEDFAITVLDSISAAVFIVDATGRVQAKNPAFKNLFTHPGEDSDIYVSEVLGCERAREANRACGDFEACLECMLGKAVGKAIKANAKTEQSYLVQTFEEVSGPVERHFQFCVDPVRYAEQTLAAVVMEEVTQLYAANERLRKLSAANERLRKLTHLKNEFLGMVAHDLRTPTSLVRGFSSILKEKVQNLLAPEDLEMLEVIFTQSDFALFLLDDLLDISELESGKLTLDLEPADFVQVVQDAVRLNRPFAARKNISVFLFCNESLPAVMIDRRKVEQVLNNLLANAVKYSNANTVVEIVVDGLAGGGVTTTIRDQGPGISQEDLGKIFDGFQKGRNRPTGGERSTGLGLMIAKRIVDAHGGCVGARSKLGEWAEFYFTIPDVGSERRDD